MPQNTVDTEQKSSLLDSVWNALFKYSSEDPWFFTEFSFLLVFGVFLLLYAFLAKHSVWKKTYLIAFSLFFYWKSSGPFLGLFALMIISDYYFAGVISKTEGRKKKVYLLLSLLYSCSFLLYFKYTNFFIENCNAFFHTAFSPQNLFLPIGISFYTFQSISYVVDVYKKEIPPVKHFLDYTFYMTFFPHLVAGPIVRAKDFIPQIDSPLLINRSIYQESMFRICIGLVKKLFIADYLAKYVDIVHMTPEGFSGGEHLLAMYAYSFQIYFDFSGYSDMAIGLALLLGYRLKENFDNPYGAENITVFWRKWHISLSLWLRDYIYIPLGGNRKGVFNMYLFLLITMLVGGFWHGADWRFVFWGAAHGTALILHKLWLQRYPESKNTWIKVLGVLVTFHFVGFCWIFFRASSFDNAFVSLQSIFTQTALTDFYGFWLARPEVVALLAASSIIVFTPTAFKQAVYQKTMNIPYWAWILVVLVVIQVIIQFKDNVVQPFIYFQF
jgi:alginate O-acetyltransferase complex protein AlgI